MDTKTCNATETSQAFADRINQSMISVNKSWLFIAREFARAKASTTEEVDFDILLKLTNYNKSTANKLIKVAKCPRIKKFENQLVLIDSWSTLHEIYKLSDQAFEAFKAEYLSSNEPKHFQRSDVEHYKTISTHHTTRMIEIRVRIDPDKVTSENTSDIEKNIREITSIYDVDNVYRTDFKIKTRVQQYPTPIFPETPYNISNISKSGAPNRLFDTVLSLNTTKAA